MIVPALSDIAKAVTGATFTHNISDTTPVSTLSVPVTDYTSIPRRRRGWKDFDISSAFSKAAESPGRSNAAASPHVNDLAERQTCASGLTYYSCANGFRGCCAGNPCNSNTSCSLEGPETSASPSASSSRTGTGTRTATSAGTRTATGNASGTASTGVSGTNTATQSNTGTGTAVSTTPTNSSSASTTPTVSVTPDSQGGGSNVGAIAGGAVGGVAALVLILALLAFFVRRHRKKVDARREGEKLKDSIKPAHPPGGRYYGTEEISRHHHSGSTANDAYTLQGGTPYGDAKPSFTKSADHFSELEGHSSKAPGLRAEGGPSMIPAAVLRPPQMLDSTPVGDKSGSKSSMFVEHMSEMEDTSRSRPSPPPPMPPQSPSTMDSPVLGRVAGASTPSLVDDTRRKQHALYWNNYSPDQMAGRPEEGMSPSLMPKAPPAVAKTPPTPAQISPPASGETRDSSFVVSPLRYTKFERGSDPGDKESKWNGYV